MAALSFILILIGLIIIIIGSIGLLIAAFREGLLHGLLMLFFGGIYSLIFIIFHWEVSRKPFFMILAGTGIIIGTSILSPLMTPKRTVASEPVAQSPAPPSEFQKKMAKMILSQLAATFKAASAKQKRTTPLSANGKPMPSPDVLMEQFSSLLVSNRAAQGKTVGPAQGTISQNLPPPPVSPSSTAPDLARQADEQTEDRSQPVSAAKPALSAEWEKARAMLRVGGVMKTGNQLLAIVNQKIVKVNDSVSVDLNGHLYHFKVRQIDLPSKTVQFDPIEP